MSFQFIVVFREFLDFEELVGRHILETLTRVAGGPINLQAKDVC